MKFINLNSSSEGNAGLVRGIIYGEVEGVRYGDLEPGVVYVPQETENAPIKVRESLLFGESGATKIPNIINTKETDGIEVVVAELLNFNLALKRRVIRIYDTESGEKFDCHYWVEIVVKLRNGELNKFDHFIESSKIKDRGWLAKATYSLATIPSSTEEKEAFYDMVQRCIETPNVPTEIIYPNAGWRNIQNLGWKYIFRQGYVGSYDSLIHTVDDKYSMLLKEEFLGTKELFDNALRMKNICKNGLTSLELLLFVHTSVLTTIFERAGYPIGFIFGVVGVTNSRKTSMAVAMAKIFDRHMNVADAEFATATECGIEKTLSLYKDGIVIIDDFKPGTNQMQQKALDSKLDYLVRLYGNRVSKKRMLDFNTEGEKKYFPINGCCLITMEIITGVQSTLSRMFISEINYSDVDNGLLAFYQNEKWILPTHLYDFLLWVTEHFIQVEQFVKERFNLLRSRHRFQFGRYADAYATLTVTAEILSDYAMERKFWDIKDRQGFLMQVEDSLLIEFSNMQSRIRRRDKATVVLTALKEAISSRSLKPTWLTDETCGLRLSCYEDETCIYIKSTLLKKIVSDYCRIYQEPCLIANKDELFGLLERVQVLDVQEKDKGREKGRKLPKQKGNTLRYMYLLKTQIDKILSEEI